MKAYRIDWQVDGRLIVEYHHTRALAEARIAEIALPHMALTCLSKTNWSATEIVKLLNGMSSEVVFDLEEAVPITEKKQRFRNTT